VLATSQRRQRRLPTSSDRPTLRALPAATGDASVRACSFSVPVSPELGSIGALVVAVFCSPAGHVFGAPSTMPLLPGRIPCIVPRLGIPVSRQWGVAIPPSRGIRARRMRASELTAGGVIYAQPLCRPWRAQAPFRLEVLAATRRQLPLENDFPPGPQTILDLAARRAEGKTALSWRTIVIRNM
jgi:hypothetical protein